ncbi:MAG: VOC family protein [Rhodanobacter sp.]
MPRGTRKQLGLNVHEWSGVRFDEDAQRFGYILWSAFAADTTRFAPRTQSFMVNFRVDDLAALLAQLRAAGVQCRLAHRAKSVRPLRLGHGRRGTRIELWQPPA